MTKHTFTILSQYADDQQFAENDLLNGVGTTQVAVNFSKVQFLQPTNYGTRVFFSNRSIHVQETFDYFNGMWS